MKVSLYQRERNGKSYIQISLIDGTKPNGTKNRRIISTGIVVANKQWDKGSKRIIKHPLRKELNNSLKSRIQFLNDLIFNNSNTKYDFENLISEYDTKYNRLIRKQKYTVSVKNDASFLDYVNLYLESAEKSGKFKTATLKTKKKFYNVFRNCFEINNINPTLDQMSLEHWDIFEKYCITELEHENVTINSYRKELFVWMNYFLKYDYTNNVFFKRIVKLEAPDKKYPILTTLEVNRIKSLLLENKPYKNYIILILFQIETGIRIGDLFTLRKENFDFTNSLVNLVTSKNKSTISIPLPIYLTKLVANDVNIFSKCSKSKYNKHIKMICKKAGLNDKIETIRYIGSKQIRNYDYKYNLISSHSFRRTMITNSIQKGMSIEILMKLIGTRDREVLMNYIQFNDSDAIEELRRIQSI
jgi:integrase